jgi:rhomboid protease GluP
LQDPGSRWKKIFFARGGLAGDNLTRYVIYVCAGMFILSVVLSRGSTGFSLNPFGFLAPNSRILLILGATGRIPIDRLHAWWSLLSASYLHAGILHILFDMMALRQIAPLIIQEYGTYRTISIYTLSGVSGFLLSYMAGVALTLGASAAICGMIGAALYYGKSRGGYFGQLVYQQIGGWAIGIFVFGFLVPGIDNWAHGGGMACGILMGFLLGYEEATPEKPFHKTLAILCIIATLGSLAMGLFSAVFYSI